MGQSSVLLIQYAHPTSRNLGGYTTRLDPQYVYGSHNQQKVTCGRHPARTKIAGGGSAAGLDDGEERRDSPSWPRNGFRRSHTKEVAMTAVSGGGRLNSAGCGAGHHTPLLVAVAPRGA